MLIHKVIIIVFIKSNNTLDKLNDTLIIVFSLLNKMKNFLSLIITI